MDTTIKTDLHPAIIDTVLHAESDEASTILVAKRPGAWLLLRWVSRDREHKLTRQATLKDGVLTLRDVVFHWEPDPPSHAHGELAVRMANSWASFIEGRIRRLEKATSTQ